MRSFFYNNEAKINIIVVHVVTIVILILIVSTEIGFVMVKDTQIYLKGISI